MNLKMNKDFIESIKIGNLAEVKSNFEEAKSNFDFKYFNKEDNYGLKPIHWACLSSDIETVQWMLQKKCNIETSSRNGWRPIHFASFVGNEEMVQFLIENFCNLNCQTDNGETVLDVANGDCNHEFIDELLNENINWKIGLSMKLKCGGDCDHKFCLRSVIQCKFHIEKQIGGGILTNVYEVKDSQSSRLFAGKTIKISDYNLSANAKCILSNINKILPKLNHRKIVKYYGLIKTKTKMILFKYHGTLRDEIEGIGALSFDKICQYCKDILQAIAFLHRNKILHGNISPKNIFIDNNGGCKLPISIVSCSLADGDVQLNIDKNDSGNSDRSFYPFRAPEVFTDGLLSYPFDIFCFGCTLIEMSTGNYLQFRWNFIKEIDEIISEIPNDMLQSFISGMVMKNPTERDNADQLFKHCFIRNITFDISNYIPSKYNNYLINHKNSIELLQTAINNKQIGLSMGLKCEGKCLHGFCLSSVTATNFKKGEKIGDGTYGKVYKIEMNSKNCWAVKIMKKIDENCKDESHYFEYDITQYPELVNHDNIVKYFGAVRNLSKIFIFMEFIDGESLYQKIKNNNFNPLPLTTIKQYTKQIIEGLEFLHNCEIIHKNIRSANILISKNNIVKIADFGLGRFLKMVSKNPKKIFYGTPNYTSPEVINDEPYDSSVDIWSLGATVFEMATGHPPFHEIKENCDIIFKIGTTRKIEYPTNMSKDLKGFLNLMINVDPKNRSSAESLLHCGFLN